MGQVEELKQGREVLPEYATLLQAHLDLLQKHTELQESYIKLRRGTNLSDDCRRYQAFENGKPVMEIYAHPSTGSEELVSLLQDAIDEIRDSVASTDSGKVVNLDAYRKRNR